MTDATTTPNPLTTLAAAELTALLAPIHTALNNIKANPTPINLVAQFVAIQGNIIGALPVLESVGIGGLAGALDTYLTEAEAKVIAAAPATGG
jgi:hypothetical protein